MTKFVGSYLAREQHILPELGNLRDAARTLFPGIPIQIEEVTGGAQEDQLLLRLNGVSIALIAVPTAIPRTEWNDAVSTPSPSAELGPVLARHQCHLVVAGIDVASDHRAVLGTSLAVSILSALICSSPCTMAFVWAPAGSVAAPHSVIRQVQALLKGGRLEAIPTDLWMRLLFTRDGDRFGAITKGLTCFLDREIEYLPADTAPVEVARHVISIAAYMIRTGRIGDGETLSLDSGEIFRARHMVRGQVPVITFKREPESIH